MKNGRTNAGVSAQTGFALQRNTALYLLLKDYEHKFKDRNYFICLEHHEDFLFCFLNQHNEADIIEAYQSKKKSTGNWTIDEEFREMITKLLATGESLLSDNFPKSTVYNHILYFTSNQAIVLKSGNKRKGTHSISIKEDNTKVAFAELPDPVKDKINQGINNSSSGEKDKLYFLWVDLNNTVKDQENLLTGQMSNLFSDKITDHKAAVKTIISLFREIEETYNKGNTAKLLDESKRVTSKVIEETLNIITSKSKCFDYWRSRMPEVSKILNIKLYERDTFKLSFETAFDLFKDIKEAEHRKILGFVKNNWAQCEVSTEEELVIQLMELFKSRESTHFDDLTLKAILFAAYFEATLNKPNINESSN